jgi:Caspase domain
MGERRLALVVATDRYDDEALRQLAAPAADAQALAEVLSDSDRGCFEVEILSNATSSAVAEQVEQLLVERRPSDLVLLHFSCHGLKDDSGELYLAATNTKPQYLASTAVDAALVNRLVRRTRAQRVVLLLDCCYGGAFERGVVARAGAEMNIGEQFSVGDNIGGGRGRVVITASSAMEYAFEGARLATGQSPEPSVFTGALVEGIRSGAADRNQDGQVDLDELYEYVYDAVQATTPNQTPCRWEFGVQGDMIIARNPRPRLVPAELPPELTERVCDPDPTVRVSAVQELTALARGDDLGLAASAARTIKQVCDDDSRRVSVTASAALRALTPTVEPSVVDLGRLTRAQRSSASVHVEGVPLALASTVQASTPEVTARLDGSSLRVEVVPRQPGPFDASVMLFGPAGEARVQLTGEISSDGRPIPKDTPAGPNLGIVIPLVVLGAVASMAALTLPSESGGFYSYRPLGGLKTTTSFSFPALLSLVAAAFLHKERHRAWALGAIAAAAAWNLVFWVKMTAQGLDLVGLAQTIEGNLTTGLWARPVAALLLGGACYLIYEGAVELHAPVHRQRGVAPLVFGSIVIVGALVPIIEALSRDWTDSYARIGVECLGMLAVCLPIALARFNRPQRVAALTAAVTFAVYTAWRDALLIHGAADPRHFAATVAGALVPLAAVLLAQARTPEP